LRDILKDILKRTIWNLEQSSGLTSTDPHLAEIRKNLLLMIAGLDLPDAPMQEGAEMEEPSHGNKGTIRLEGDPTSIALAGANRCCTRLGSRQRCKGASQL